MEIVSEGASDWDIQISAYLYSRFEVLPSIVASSRQESEESQSQHPTLVDDEENVFNVRSGHS